MSVGDAMDLLELYLQDFIMEFGEIKNGFDSDVLKRRLQAHYAQLVLGWIAAGELLEHPFGWAPAVDASRDMAESTHSHLARFIDAIKSELPAWSLRESQELGFPS